MNARVLSSYCVGPRDHMQAFRLSSLLLYPPGHLLGPNFMSFPFYFFISCLLAFVFEAGSHDGLELDI